MSLGSAAIAVAIGAPGHAQIAYMLALPVPVMWPVMLGGTLWFVVVAGLWWMWLRRADVAAQARRLRLRATILAVLLSAPKLMLLQGL